jgi:hypothetical protein
MRWNLKYSIKSYIRGSMWLCRSPRCSSTSYFTGFTYAVGDWLCGPDISTRKRFSACPCRVRVDARDGYHAHTLSFLVFTFAPLLSRSTVAGASTPADHRDGTLLRDNVIRFTVGCFVFTMVFALRVLSRMDERSTSSIPSSRCFSGTLSVMVFLYLIDYAARFRAP